MSRKKLKLESFKLESFNLGLRLCGIWNFLVIESFLNRLVLRNWVKMGRELFIGLECDWTEIYKVKKTIKIFGGVWTVQKYGK